MPCARDGFRYGDRVMPPGGGQLLPSAPSSLWEIARPQGLNQAEHLTPCVNVIRYGCPPKSELFPTTNIPPQTHTHRHGDIVASWEGGAFVSQVTPILGYQNVSYNDKSGYAFRIPGYGERMPASQDATPTRPRMPASQDATLLSRQIYDLSAIGSCFGHGRRDLCDL